MVDITPTSPDYFIPNRFQNKTLLITGAATGIGAATAIRAAREGAKVVGLDRKERELNETISQIKGEGHQAIAIVGNVVETEVCDRAVADAVRVFGGLDLALNAAGVMDGGDPAQPLNFNGQRNLLPNTLHEATDEYWEAVVATNTTGMFKSLRAQLRQMVQQGRGGAIVNIGSIAGMTGLSGNPAYVASKHGVTGLTRNAALDYAPLRHSHQLRQYGGHRHADGGPSWGVCKGDAGIGPGGFDGRAQNPKHPDGGRFSASIGNGVGASRHYLVSSIA